jgi:hypothetical protein
MSHTIENFENYINKNKKIFIHQLNSNPYVEPELPAKKQKLDDDELIEMEDINYKFNDIKINISDNDVGDENENYKLYHLNISHLNSNNTWIVNNHYYSEQKQNDFVKHIKQRYLDNSNGFKKNKDKDKYKIISETCKINLDKGIINQEFSGYTSTILLNQSKLYDGMTNLCILTNPTTKIITSVKIRARAKDNNKINPTYRDILCDLEFEECDDGYKILGLDNFIHISLVGLEEIFLGVKYNVEGTLDLRLGWLKFDRCYYNSIIKANLATHLYENEETYFVDIVDWIVQEVIDINQQQQMYGNILRIISGLGGICYSN